MGDICLAPNPNANVYVRVLHDACLLLGGEHHLAKYLAVDVGLVERWLKGLGNPPDHVFLRCSDLLHSRRALDRTEGQLDA